MKIYFIVIFLTLNYSCIGILNNSFKVVDGDTHITKIKSKYIGKEYVTKTPLFYFHNLPTSNCLNRICVYLSKVRLRKIDNYCKNCLLEKRIITPIRISVLYPESKLRVTDAFKTEKIALIGGGEKERFIILTDEKGIVSEMKESTFRMRVAKNYKNQDNSIFEEKLKNFENIINEHGHYKYWGRLKHKKMNGYNKQQKKSENYWEETRANIYVKRGPILELKIARFVNIFMLEKELKINKIGTFYKDERSKYSCVEFEIRTVDAYLLSYYYFEKWGIDIEIFNSCEKDNKCIDQNPNLKGITKIDFNQIRNLSHKELLRYRRDELN